MKHTYFPTRRRRARRRRGHASGYVESDASLALVEALLLQLLDIGILSRDDLIECLETAEHSHRDMAMDWQTPPAERQIHRKTATLLRDLAVKHRVSPDHPDG